MTRSRAGGVQKSSGALLKSRGQREELEAVDSREHGLRSHDMRSLRLLRAQERLAAQTRYCSFRTSLAAC